MHERWKGSASLYCGFMSNTITATALLFYVYRKNLCQNNCIKPCCKLVTHPPVKNSKNPLVINILPVTDHTCHLKLCFRGALRCLKGHLQREEERKSVLRSVLSADFSVPFCHPFSHNIQAAFLNCCHSEDCPQ